MNRQTRERQLKGILGNVGLAYIHIQTLMDGRRLSDPRLRMIFTDTHREINPRSRRIRRESHHIVRQTPESPPSSADSRWLVELICCIVGSRPSWHSHLSSFCLWRVSKVPQEREVINEISLMSQMNGKGIKGKFFQFSGVSQHELKQRQIFYRTSESKGLLLRCGRGPQRCMQMSVSLEGRSLNGLTDWRILHSFPGRSSYGLNINRQCYK